MRDERKRVELKMKLALQLMPIFAKEALIEIPENFDNIREIGFLVGEDCLAFADGFLDAIASDADKESSTVERKAFVCVHCEGVYADDPVSSCGCMGKSGNGDFVEGIVRYKLPAEAAWIENDGESDVCPVPADAIISIVYRNNVATHRFRAEWAKRWIHTGASNDIMKYREHKADEQKTAIAMDAEINPEGMEWMQNLANEGWIKNSYRHESSPVADGIEIEIRFASGHIKKTTEPSRYSWSENRMAAVSEITHYRLVDGWVENDGSGKCPLPAGTKSQIRFADGEIADINDPQNFTWVPNGFGSDITHYRKMENDNEK